MPSLAPDQQHFERLAREQLSEVAFREAWNRGRRMTPEQMVDFAMNPENDAGFSVNDANLVTRARALSVAGRLAWHDSDFGTSRVLIRQGLDTAQQSGDTSSFVHAVAAVVRLSSIGGDTEGDITHGRQLAEEAVRLARKDGDEALLIEALIAHCYAAVMLDELAGMREVHREAIHLSCKLGDDRQLATALISLAMLAYREEQFGETRALLGESLALCRRLDAPFLLFAALWQQ